jgi:hypothetical protein
METCRSCGSGLLHEILIIVVIGLGGYCRLCPRCARATLDRLERADDEAAELLENLWRVQS